MYFFTRYKKPCVLINHTISCSDNYQLFCLFLTPNHMYKCVGSGVLASEFFLLVIKKTCVLIKLFRIMMTISKVL